MFQLFPMAKKEKKISDKSVKKTLLKEIEVKLSESVQSFHKKISDKKFQKQIHKAGKILSKSLTRDKITVVHKEKKHHPEKGKKTAEIENIS